MTSKTDSKSNLNESTLPLLDDDANKEKIELKAKEEGAATTGEASAASTAAGDEAKAAKEKEAEEAKRKKEEEKERKRQLKEEEEEKKKQAKLEKQKKKEEEKEQKKLKKAEKKAAAEAAKANGGASEQLNRASRVHPLCSITTFTTPINLLDRDERSVNSHVNLNFEDILGEPDAIHGFDGAYRLSYGLFQLVRFWVYRLFMAVLAVPLALLWAVVFALLSVFSVWILTPAFRVLDLLFYFVHRIWNVTVRTLLDPVFASISLVRSSSPIHPFHRTPRATYSGRAISSDYHSVPTSDDACYKKCDSEDDVTDKQITLNIENV